ncbi:MAG: sodium:proton antiporter [Proteobacteria bacterium]|nr:sodium:proton antiporter [Pseudomonadota bacterium]MBU1687834.1 sodium:proton antiporter [Pseudomonadota bacterium]
MSFFQILAVLLTLSALFGYLNHRFLKLPEVIGTMLISMVFSLLLIVTEGIFPAMLAWGQGLLASLDFSEFLLHGILSFLLFAGALHVEINDLKQQWRVITGLATGGVLLSTGIIGYTSWLLFNTCGFEISLMHCLLFGALISPTDPIAVLSLLKSAGAPKSLEVKITGESLFNDGVGVVVFLLILGLISSDHHSQGLGGAAMLFLREAVGGGLLGAGLGYVTYRLLRSIDQYQIEVLLTLSLAAGGYVLAEAIHVSAPIAIVVAGLMIGNHGRRLAMSQRTCEHLDQFWELIDSILNQVLFLLMGLELVAMNYTAALALPVLGLIPLALLARLLSVATTVTFLKPFRNFSPHAIKILTWGGLRGGISLAMALSVPPGPAREIILMGTYAVVVFSVLVQGLTLKPLLQKYWR